MEKRLSYVVPDALWLVKQTVFLNGQIYEKFVRQLICFIVH